MKRFPLLAQPDHVQYHDRRTRGVLQSPMASQLSALNGPKIIAQGKRDSAPPWVKAPSESTPLLRPKSLRGAETSSQGGGEGKGSGGGNPSIHDLCRAPRIQSNKLWTKISIHEREFKARSLHCTSGNQPVLPFKRYMGDLHKLARNCEDQIIKGQLPEGGWGFGDSRQWVTEMTALSLLALRLRPSTVYARGLEFLLRCQNPNGSWPGFAGDDTEGSWVTALAVIAVIRLGGNWKEVEKGISWLLKTQGRESHWLMRWRYRTVDQKVRFDLKKYGWPWTVGASSWVVPTCFSMIALRQYFTCCLPEAAEIRLEKGTAMLLDRGCTGGGWNAGNGVVYGVPLKAHVDVTSLALLALLPQKDRSFVKTSLNWLQSQWEEVPSIYSLSWMAMALAAYQQPVQTIMKKLIQLHSRRGMNQDCQSLALTRIALQVADEANPFK